jgi:hypothetical protein
VLITSILSVLTMVGTVALCFVCFLLGRLPADTLAEMVKWTIAFLAGYAAIAAFVGSWAQKPWVIRPGDDSPPELAVNPVDWGQISPLGQNDPLARYGTLASDVFDGAMGDEVPAHYTSMERDLSAPQVTTEAPDGSHVVVPVHPSSSEVETDTVNPNKEPAT